MDITEWISQRRELIESDTTTIGDTEFIVAARTALPAALNRSSPRSAQGRVCSTCSGGGCPDCTDSPYT